MHFVRTFILSMLCFLVLVPGVMGQSVMYDDQVNFYHPTATGETGLFTGIVGETLRQGDWSFSVYLNYYDFLAAEPTPSMIVPSRRPFGPTQIEESRVTASIGYGLTDRWEVVASVPYHMIEQKTGDRSGFYNGRPFIGRFDENGLGKLHLGTKFGLLDPNTSAARVALSLFVDAPTGDEDIVVDNADFGIGLHWNKSIFSFGGTYKLVGEADNNPDDFLDTPQLSDEVRVDAGLNIPLHFWSTTNWINEINAIAYTGGDREPDDIVYLVTGVRHWFGESGWALNAALRANATQYFDDTNTCPLGGLVGLSFAPLHLAALPPPPPPVELPPPPMETPVPPPPPPVATPPQRQELRTDEIQFESGSARLTNIAKAILDDVALRMKQEPAATAIVIGYTDNRESTGPNADLDRRRAEAVRDYLVSRHNIDPARITVEAQGPNDPIGDNATAEGRQRNRRVVIRLIIP